MAPRSTSPTTLLWAHQLKREHNYLLQRIKELETANGQLNDRMKNTEATNKEAQAAAALVAELSIRVQAMEEDDNDQQLRFERLDRDRSERIEKQEGAIKAVERKIRALEGQYRELQSDEERFETLTQDNKSALTRIEKLETLHAQIREISAQSKLVRKDDPTNPQVLNRRIELLETRRTEDGVRVKAMTERLKLLENELNSTRGKLEQALKSQSKRAANPTDDLAELPQPTPQILSSSPSGIQVPASPIIERQARRQINLRPRHAQQPAELSSTARQPNRFMPAQNATTESRTTRSGAQFSQYTPAGADVLSTQGKRLGSPEAANSRKKRKAVATHESNDSIHSTPIKVGSMAVTEAKRRDHHKKANSTLKGEESRKELVNLKPASTTDQTPVPQTRRPRRRIILSPLPPLEEL